jgi:predicted DNA binding protein
MADLFHTGVKRKSGRYEWGSGEHPYQHEPWFMGWKELADKGMKESEIAKHFHMSLKEFRYRKSYAENAEKAAMIAHVKEMRFTRQMSPKAIGEKLGISVSTVNKYLDPVIEANNRKTYDLAEALAKSVDEKHWIDIGKGVNVALGVKQTKFEAALQVLKDEGYQITKFDQPQATNPKQNTHIMVLTAPNNGTTEKEKKSIAYKDIMQNKDKIALPYDVHVDSDGKTSQGIYEPKSISSKRIFVRYAEDGGTQRDGSIELRRGVADIDMNGSRYAQVRIAVDGTHYIKGVAIYSDDIPDGYDIIVNSNKKRGTPLLSKDPEAKTVLKPMERDENGEVDMENPFGAQIMAGGQHFYKDKNGKEQLSAINKVNDENKWGDWTSARTIASQVLSKQDKSLAKRQLDLAYAQNYQEYEEIQKITNPVLKAKMLEDFGDTCDKKAEHLKAAALPRQSVKVLIPLPSLKENECYAPDYPDGEVLALIRYPHGGKAEIPILINNTRNKQGRNMIGTGSGDGIGINAVAAERLSGADFDGDTVVCIPNKHNWIKNAPQLEALKDFDTKAAYPGYPGMKRINEQYQQTQMGMVTNLITDMTLKGGANPDELARAIKYSMVIIDAYKHKLDYKTCFKECRIDELYEKYQKKGGGASTIISRASSQDYIPDYDRKGIDPETGERTYHFTGKRNVEFINPKTGKKYVKALSPNHPDYDPNANLSTIETSKMYTHKDAYDLVSEERYPIEKVYADYANSMKALANKARKESLNTGTIEYNSEAAKAYADEVTSLKNKVNQSLIQAPLERKAQLVTGYIVDQKMKNNPERYDRKTPDGKKKIKKLRESTIKQQRAILGKAKPSFDITDKEWEAIQSGAVRLGLLKQVLQYGDQERIKKLATPREVNTPALSPANILTARAMLNSKYTLAEVANYYGISVSTLQRYLKK